MGPFHLTILTGFGRAVMFAVAEVPDSRVAFVFHLAAYRLAGELPSYLAATIANVF